MRRYGVSSRCTPSVIGKSVCHTCEDHSPRAHASKPRDARHLDRGTTRRYSRAPARQGPSPEERHPVYPQRFNWFESIPEDAPRLPIQTSNRTTSELHTHECLTKINSYRKNVTGRGAGCTAIDLGPSMRRAAFIDAVNPRVVFVLIVAVAVIVIVVLDCAGASCEDDNRPHVRHRRLRVVALIYARSPPLRGRPGRRHPPLQRPTTHIHGTGLSRWLFVWRCNRFWSAVAESSGLRARARPWTKTTGPLCCNRAADSCSVSRSSVSTGNCQAA